MESQTIQIIISPEVLLTNISDVTVSGETYGVYSGMTQMLQGGQNNTSLFTGFTFPILLLQNTIDVGYYSIFDGAISQLDVVNNFIFSSTTMNPYRWYVYNTSEISFNNFLSLSSYFIDWGDGTPQQVINSYSPNSIYHDYPQVMSAYTITMLQRNPWGNTTISKNIQTPFTNVQILNPQGEAFFTPIVGTWTGTPISYNFIFSGDSECDIQGYENNPYVTLPFNVSGITSSRLNELSNYGANQFQLLFPIKKNGIDYGIITEINLTYTAYTIQDIEYYDYNDGTTIYFLQSSGLTSQDLVCEPIYKNEALLNVVSEPQVQSNIFIDRGKNSALERVQRIGEVDNLRDLETYGYGFFEGV